MAPLYSLNPLRATRQLLGDLVFLFWCAFWWVVAGRVADLIRSAAEPGLTAGDRVRAVSGQVGEAADRASDLPLIGDRVSDPLRSVSGALQEVAAMGNSQAETLYTVAHWLQWSLLGVTVALGLLAWFPTRFRFVRDGLRLRAFRGSAAGESLLALRAMSTQPLHRLRRVHPDPVAAWRAEDPAAVHALAQLELREYGLSS